MMIFSEILVLFLALVISVTLVLMLRKLFFGRETKINSRELFESATSKSSEGEFVEEGNLDEPSKTDILDPSQQEEEIANTHSDMITLHLQNTEESKFSYDAIKKFLSSNNIEHSDEGGWFKISIEEDDSFLLVNGLNPGKFIPEDGLIETPIMTLIYSFKSKANSVSAFSKMIEITQLIAENFESEILDSDRNSLTKQMVDHYSEAAEEFDLKNLT